MMRLSISKGDQFGQLTVLGEVSRDWRIDSHIRYSCLCTCGSVVNISSSCLVSGDTKSCGCLRRNIGLARRKFLNPGDKFNRWTVIKEVGPLHSQVGYECRCNCGTIQIVGATSLRNGYSKSCGCISRENTIKRNFKHGLSKTKAYKCAVQRKRKDKMRSLDVNWSYAMESMLKRVQKECILCGETESLTIDHVRPVFQGYGLEPGNAILLCRKCNSRKNKKGLEDLDPLIAAKIKDAAENFRRVWESRNEI